MSFYSSMPSVPITASSRLKKDYAKLMRDPVPYVIASPTHANILEWYVWCLVLVIWVLGSHKRNKNVFMGKKPLRGKQPKIMFIAVSLVWGGSCRAVFPRFENRVPSRDTLICKAILTTVPFSRMDCNNWAPGLQFEGIRYLLYLPDILVLILSLSSSMKHSTAISSITWIFTSLPQSASAYHTSLSFAKQIFITTQNVKLISGIM